MEQNFLLCNPEAIAYTCSERHIQSVIEDMQDQLITASRLKNMVLSLNPNCTEIGAGMLAQLQDLAKQLDKI